MCACDAAQNLQIAGSDEAAQAAPLRGTTEGGGSSVGSSPTVARAFAPGGACGAEPALAALMPLPPAPRCATADSGGDGDEQDGGKASFGAVTPPSTPDPQYDMPLLLAPLTDGSCLDIAAALGTPSLAHPLLVWLPVRVLPAHDPAADSWHVSSARGGGPGRGLGDRANPHAWQAERGSGAGVIAWAAAERPEVVRVSRLGQAPGMPHGVRGHGSATSGRFTLPGTSGAAGSGSGFGSGFLQGVGVPSSWHAGNSLGAIQAQSQLQIGAKGAVSQPQAVSVGGPLTAASGTHGSVSLRAGGQAGGARAVVLEVGLEYSGQGGSQRSFRCWLDVAVRPAFKIEVRLREC